MCTTELPGILSEISKLEIIFLHYMMIYNVSTEVIDYTLNSH